MKQEMGQKPVILLVEDSLDDVALVKRSFERTGLGYPLQVARNAEEARAYLEGAGSFSDRARYPLPGLILLDLKMPGEDGFEFLTWLRGEKRLTGLPVVVLTASDQIRDVNRAYELGANSFLVKPLDFENFVETSRALQRYWLGISLRPDSGQQLGKGGAAQAAGAEGMQDSAPDVPGI
jgi:CheY-like chemotaxis protein